MSKYFRYESYDSEKGYITEPEKNVKLYFGAFIECDPQNYKKSEIYIMPDECSGSDYSGGIYNISNHRSFLKMFKNVDGVYDVWGGLGTFLIAIRLDVYESNEEIKEVIDSLKDYCIIDEEDLTQLEYNLQDKAWKNWAKSDMIRLIKSSHNFLEDFEEENLPDFDSLFYQSAEEANEYWEPDGNDVYIRLENICPYLRDRILVKIMDRKDLPLLMGHDWKSEKAKKEFTKLFTN